MQSAPHAAGREEPGAGDAGRCDQSAALRGRAFEQRHGHLSFGEAGLGLTEFCQPSLGAPCAIGYGLQIGQPDDPLPIQMTQIPNFFTAE
jgi:hypothetical protein